MCLGLASAATQAGLRTLLVDMDPQADTTLAVGAWEAGSPTIAAVLRDPVRSLIDAAAVARPWGDRSIDVVTGSPESLAYDAPADPRTLTGLSRALQDHSDRWDLVLIDCPPSSGGLTRQGLAASHRALVVTEPGLFAVTAAARALETVDDVRRTLAPRLQPLGVVVNRARAHTSEHAYRISELQRIFGPLILSPTLPERTALQQAQGAGLPIHQWPGPAARELSEIFDTLLARARRSFTLQDTSY